jgi:hypothetical protein
MCFLRTAVFLPLRNANLCESQLEVQAASLGQRDSVSKKVLTAKEL